MKKILVDSGPLIALFDEGDQYHSQARDFLKNFKGLLCTTWPVLTEATHLLDFDFRAQISCLEWVDKAFDEIVALEGTHLREMIDLMRKYQDLPMDLADASLILAAQILETYHVITLDKDFTIYRLPHKKTFNNLLSL